MQPSDRLKFMLAGNATFTIVSKKTGVRFTYRVRKAPPKPGKLVRPFFVSVLTSPDVYTYIGWISYSGAAFVSGGGLSSGAPSIQAFDWFWSDVETTKVEFHHAGKCGRCGRELTVPESIESGLGPECARRAS